MRFTNFLKTTVDSMKNMTFIPHCLVALLLSMPSPTPATDTGAITGQISDAETQAPIGWVLVVIEELDYVRSTDVDGFFSFNDISPGEYVLKTLRIGYGDARFPVKITAATTTQLQLKLSHVPLKAEGLVIEGETFRTISTLQEPEVVFGGKKLRQNLSRTIAETIVHEPGIAQRSMGPAPARPVLRGLGGDRLLVLEDGERTGDLSGSSSDHAVAIEPMTTERIEIVRGPEVLLYGSNALAGVVNVVRGYIPTEKPARQSGSLTWQGETVNRGLSGGLVFSRALGPFALRLDGSLRDAGEIYTPQGALPNTYIRTENASLGLGLVKPWGHAGLAGSLYNSAYGIPPDPQGGHPGGVQIDLQRQHVVAKAEIRAGSVWLQRLELQHSFSRYQHGEFEQSGALGMEFGVLTHNSSAIARTRAIGPLQDGTVGLWYEYRNYAAGGLNFTPAAEEKAVALFTYQEWPLGSFSANAALRADGRRVAPRRTRTSRNLGRIDTRYFSGISGGLSGRYQVGSSVAIGFSLLRTFRAPGIEELFSEGPHLAAYSYEVGNADLNSEHGLGLELSLDYDRPTGHLHLAIFRNEIDGYIFPRNTGQYSLRRADLFLYQTVGEQALMHGVEAAFGWHFHPKIEVAGTLSVVRGILTSKDDQYIPRLPPLQGRLNLIFEASEAFNTDLSLRLASDQDRLGQFEDPTSGYAVFDLSGSYYRHFRGHLHTLSLTVENITDDIYRTHLNRVKELMPEPGRNVRILFKTFF